MTQEHAGAWTRTSRIIRARPEQLYQAFIDPAALVAWLPPAEMTGKIHAFDARVGGGYRMSLFYPPDERAFRGKTSEKEDMVDVRFVELTPARRIGLAGGGQRGRFAIVAGTVGAPVRMTTCFDIVALVRSWSFTFEQRNTPLAAPGPRR
jgi:uncharacterized protein YndB with AHSA1/START domain